jgi:biopolymer transport protein ExbD
VTQGAEQDNIYITITKQKEIIMDGTTVTFEELNNNLALRQSEKDKVVAIIADKNLNYSLVAELLLVLQDQDFLNIIFMSQPREEQKKL